MRHEPLKFVEHKISGVKGHVRGIVFDKDGDLYAEVHITNGDDVIWHLSNVRPLPKSGRA